MRIDSSDWSTLAPHVDLLLQLPNAERSTWLATLEQTDAATANQLRVLLEARDAASAASFLGGVAATGLLPATVTAGDMLGPWTLAEAVGEGGMGSVWRARRNDGRFEGEAAIKLLRAGLLHASAKARFRHEGAILARLRHPGIAQLLDAGVSERGQPYLVLEFIDGLRIDQWCDARSMPLAARIGLLLRVADAVASAHAQLVIHRDLKPSNILVTSAGEPKLLDFGIARLVGEDATAALTRDGAFALTPEYAAPEQFSQQPLTIATDVYALGVLLHELLVGVHPSGLAAAPAIAYLKAASDGLAMRPSDRCTLPGTGLRAPADRAAARETTPRALGRALAGDLDQVLAKALATRPIDRYASVADLAQDLRRHLASEPVLARPPAVGYRFRKLLRRRPFESGLVAAVALAIIIGMTATVWQWRIAERERLAATAERERAERMLARALVANDFTHTLMTELAQVPHPVRFMDLLERGERMALDDAHGDPAQRAHVLLQIADFRLTGADAARGGPLAERAAAIATAAGDRPLAAIARCEHALAAAEEGRGDAADAEVSQALMLAGDDPEALSKCYMARGWAATAGGRGAIVLDYAHRAAEAQARMPWTAPSTRVELLDLRGTGETLVGDYAASDASFRGALALLDSSGRGQGLQAATVWNNLANNLDSQGRLPESLDAYRRALQIERAIVGDDGVPVPSWTNLGRMLARLHQFDEAWSVTVRGLEAARRAHDEVAQFYGPLVLANIRREQRRFAQAREQLSVAARHVGEEKPGSTMGASLDVALVREALAEHHPAEALRLLDRLQANIHRYEHDSKTHEVSDVFSQTFVAIRAQAAADLGRLADALVLAQQALALARSQQGTVSLSADTAAALELVARLQMQAGDRAAARATAAEAVRPLETTFGAHHPLTVRVRALLASTASR
jgi:serine/threonine-protein kinase